MLYGFQVSFRFVAQIAQIHCNNFSILTATEAKQLAVHIDQQLLNLVQPHLSLLRWKFLFEECGEVLEEAKKMLLL